MSNPESFLEHGELIDSETVESAQKYFAIAEEASRALDALAEKLLKNEPITLKDITNARAVVNRTVFGRSCDILGLTEQQRTEIIDNT
jgi:hypothetical protein